MKHDLLLYYLGNYREFQLCILLAILFVVLLVAVRILDSQNKLSSSYMKVTKGLIALGTILFILLATMPNPCTMMILNEDSFSIQQRNLVYSRYGCGACSR